MEKLIINLGIIATSVIRLNLVFLNILIFLCTQYLKKDHSQTVVNEGNFDISESPSCNILVQGLDALTSEESLYDKFYPFGAHKVFLLRDRFTRSSLGFGFVLFHDVSVSLLALNKRG